jgi:hypothetical protein
MTQVASWYHCSVKTISRSAGRTVVGAAAYRLGERFQDHRTAEIHDYRRRSGVVVAFTVAPPDAPAWVLTDPERLWNAAEARETRVNSQTGRECELALPAAVGAKAREGVARDFAQAFVDRYGVAVTVAIHRPSRQGDDRNFHAHVLMTTRRMGASGLGEKTRELDARKTGPDEVLFIRELACNLINDALERAGVDERVDHRSFTDRGIVREPTEHLGPTASEIERRGETSEKGEMNRQIEQHNAEMDELVNELAAIDAEIAREQEQRLDERYGPAEPETCEEVDADPRADGDARIARTPAEEEAQLELDAAPFDKQITQDGEIRQEGLGGLSWWERAAAFGSKVIHDAREFISGKWQKYVAGRRGREETDRDGPDLTR